MTSRLVLIGAAAALSTGALVVPASVHAGPPTAATTTRAHDPRPAAAATPQLLGHFDHLVVIYEENHSFDNLYGRWGRVGKDRVDGVSQAKPGTTVQVAQDGSAYKCVPQTDVNLTAPALAPTCRDAAHGIRSAFTNSPFVIDDYIAPTDKTCPGPGMIGPRGILRDTPGALPGGCTRDLVHRFYQEQYQLNDGKQNRYVTGSDAVGLTMGGYDTTQLPLYKFLHRNGAPNYVIADRFFQGAFGGSFLNHQWLIAGRPPIDSSHSALDTKHAVIDSNGMPSNAPLYTATGPVMDGGLSVECPDGNPANYELACGDFAVNTVQPSNLPYSPNAPRIGLIDDAQYPNIGDRLTEKGVSWAWYSGGWDDAVAGNPSPEFQYHHQPFNYYADYGPGQPGRVHLQDETDYLSAAASGDLPTVSFVKPSGLENQHPGSASTTTGDQHLVKLLKAAITGPDADSTLVLITYDEYGGQWDHVPPPGQGTATPGAHDAFGPGTRIPAMLVSKQFTRSGVDHTVYDTTSIIASIERSLGLDPVGIRDADVNSLRAAVKKGRAK